MFRSAANVRRYLDGRSCTAVAAAVAVASSGLLLFAASTPSKSKSECENDTSSVSACPPTTTTPFRILIVGSGLTGSLTALRIRQRLRQARQEANSKSSSSPSTFVPTNKSYYCQHHHHQQQQKDEEVDITVVERASYPAGRFGAIATHGNCHADIGAQVLSTINPNDFRAMGGHGVTVSDIRTSAEITRALLSAKLISRANDAWLGETEERMIWEGLWEHYYATPTLGLGGVLRRLLSWANVEPRFGVRVDSLDVLDGRDDGGMTIRVEGVSRTKKNSTDPTTTGDEEAFAGCYDCVVLCIPAPSVLEMGLGKYLSSNAMHVLNEVRYDQRTCEAHFFSGDIASHLAKVFSDKTELMVDDGEENDKSRIQYISWQNRKRCDVTNISMDTETCALVVHGQPGQLEPLGNELDSILSKLTGIPSETIASLRLYSKSIQWHASQMIKPMEAVVADPPTPACQCIVGDGSGGSGIIIAGDFMTQSSFVGCVASADAAARAVVENLNNCQSLL